MVLLRHELEDAGSHFDWMIDPGAGRGLISFRLSCRFDLGGSEQFEAIRIPDHRRLYLEYEGPISGNRGRVVRLACGSVAVLGEEEDRLRLVGHLGDWTGILVGQRESGDSWRFRVC